VFWPCSSLSWQAWPPLLSSSRRGWWATRPVIWATRTIVLVALTVVLWRARLRSNGLGTGGRAVIVSAGTAAPLLALSALAVVMANVQGAMAPFASLLPMLMDGTPDDGLTDTLAQARQQLADSHRTSGYTPAALDAMVSDFAWYHAVLAVLAVVVAVGLAGLSWVLWRSVARTDSADRPTRRVLGWFGVLSALSSLIVLVVFVANAGTAMDPAPALLGLFNGGF
jgi:heme/copper-type cytochrome/quinol oxidase subunit 2